MKRTIITGGCLISVALSFAPPPVSAGPGDSPLRAVQDEASQTIKIYRANGKDPVVTVNVRRDARPLGERRDVESTRQPVSLSSTS